MAEQEQSRSEPATPYRLEQARQKGSVARSMEVSALAALATLWLVLTAWGRDGLHAQFKLDAALLALAGRSAFEPGAAGLWLQQVLGASLHQLLPLLLPLMAVAVLVGLLQVGVVLSTHPLKPDIERLNPVAGFKRVFNSKLLFETAKNLLKLVLFGTVLWWLLRGLVAPLLALMLTDPRQYLDSLLVHARRLVGQLLLVLAAVALADLAFTRWQWRDKLKMSRRELREELKSREGDPRVRARHRDLRRELARRASAVRRVPEADVLITNPTHLAVALLYRRDTMDAPQVIAKGSGEVAAQMRLLARRHRVPVVRNPSLARALFRQAALESAIPERLYPPVARLLVWVYALRAAHHQGPTRPVAEGHT